MPRPTVQMQAFCWQALGRGHFHGADGWKWLGVAAIDSNMSTTQETVTVHTHRVACDGAGDIRKQAGFAAAALGHPRVYLEIDERGFVDCPYCDKRFVLDDHNH
jgi:uncharacterized Zn-finger protein